MTRQAHDQLAKQYLAELLTALGQVETSLDVSSEVRQVDIWFVPISSSSTDVKNLGLLNLIAKNSCVIEVFRNAPTAVEVRNCQLKLYAKHGEMLRTARKEKTTLTEPDLPFLWILSPTCSANFLDSFGAKSKNESNFPEGVYFLPDSQKTAIVAINQLPENLDTLYVRVLGRGGTQKRAIEELVALPNRDVLLNNLLEILASWRTNLQLKNNLSNEEQEEIMNLSPAYEKQREEWKLEGKEEGNLLGQRLLVTSLIQGRFGTLDEELYAIIKTIMELPIGDRTQLLLNLSNLSREELLSRLGGN